jgi:hypothetical protein
VRLALGVTVAALAVGVPLTAHADTAGPVPQKAKNVDLSVCEDPDPSPVEAVPDGKVGNPKPLPQQTAVIVGECGPDYPNVGEPVDATPVPGEK